MKKQKEPKRRNLYAASLADGKFKPRVVQVKKRKLLGIDVKQKYQWLEEANV